MRHMKRVVSLLLLTALILSSALPAYAATHYKYDALGRLIEVTHSSGKRITYTYDAMGNMTAVVTSSETIIDGFNVSGKVRSHNPNNPVTLQLKQGNEVKYTTTIAAEPGSGATEYLNRSSFGQNTFSPPGEKVIPPNNDEVLKQLRPGQRDQDFTFENVEAGIYTLVITKAAHLKFTVQNVVVRDRDLDLRQDTRLPERIITLLTGDLNGDGQINSGDLLILLGSYLETGENLLADLNGDGQVNSSDLLILLEN